MTGKGASKRINWDNALLSERVWGYVGCYELGVNLLRAAMFCYNSYLMLNETDPAQLEKLRLRIQPLSVLDSGLNSITTTLPFVLSQRAYEQRKRLEEMAKSTRGI